MDGQFSFSKSKIDYVSEYNDTVDREIDRAYRYDNVVESTKRSIDVT